MGKADESKRSGGDGIEAAWSRERLLVGVLLLGTLLLIGLCYLLAKPFLPALAWALALSIVARPVQRWIGRRVRCAPIAAGLSVLLIALIVVAPSSFVIQILLRQVTAGLEALRSGTLQAAIERVVTRNPSLAELWHWAESQASLGGSAGELTGSMGKWVSGLIGGSISGTISLVVAFFFLFYFLRDRDSIVAFVRSLLPLSDGETDQVLTRVRDTVYASIYGTLAVASVQGALGGLMFWWLGLPAPVLWGVVMGLLSIIPVLGAFVIWFPAALFLAMQGQWGKAVILALWGTVVIGLIDNLLYPVLVGTRLRLHTVPVFIAIVGGLAVFGASGLVLGPVILALTDAAIHIWRCRTTCGSAEKPCPDSRVKPEIARS